MSRKPYPINASDEERDFVVPYLSLLSEDASSRRHDLREIFNAFRWIVRTGAPWRMPPTNLPPWQAACQQFRRWIKAGVFEDIVNDRREVLRLDVKRETRPRAAIIDSKTLRSTLESGGRAGYDGAKRKNGSKVHVAVDALGNHLALHVTPADAQDRAQAGKLAEAVQAATGRSAEIIYADQGYTGEKPAAAVDEHGIRLEIVKLPQAKRGFVLLPRRWVVERSLAWAARFRRLARDYERLPHVLAGLHVLAFACLILAKAAHFLQIAHNTI